jgi:flagellar biosynthesis/type III secretory pathway ATPase
MGKRRKPEKFSERFPAIDWEKALARSKRMEQIEDARQVAKMVKELYRIFKKHGQIN